MNEFGKYIEPPYYSMKEFSDNRKSYFPEVENLDTPGIDNFSEYEGIYWCWQPNTVLINGEGRWVITDNLINPGAANQAYYYSQYYRIDQAIEAFKKELNGSKS